MYEPLRNGIFVGSSYSHYYSFDLATGGNVFLSLAGDTGSSAIYRSDLSFVATVSSEPMFLPAGSYIVHARYSSPNLAALAVYVPQWEEPGDLVQLGTGSYKGSNWDHYYGLTLSSGRSVLVEVHGDSGRSAIYDQALNLVANLSSEPIYLQAGSYVVHAEYSSKNQAVLEAFIPEGTTAGNPSGKTFIGTSAGDLFIAGVGNDTIDGGGGVDGTIYSGMRANYLITKSAGGFAVHDRTGLGGTDTLQDIERLEFTDVSIAFDISITQSGGMAALLLGAVLPGKLAFEPIKQSLMGDVIELFDDGFSMNQLAGAALRLPIWDLLTGSSAPSNSDIARYLLTNVNGNAPDQATLAAAVNALNSEQSQGDWLAGLGTSSESQVHIGLVGLVTLGLSFL